MGQAQKTPEREKCTKKTYDDMSFKFNARAREFVPRSYTQMPASAYFYPGFNFLGRSIGGGSDWLFVGYQEPPAYLISNPDVVAPHYRTKTVLTDDLKQKIIKQVIGCDHDDLGFLVFVDSLFRVVKQYTLYSQSLRLSNTTICFLFLY